MTTMNPKLISNCTVRNPTKMLNRFHFRRVKSNPSSRMWTRIPSSRRTWGSSIRLSRKKSSSLRCTPNVTIRRMNNHRTHFRRVRASMKTKSIPKTTPSSPTSTLHRRSHHPTTSLIFLLRSVNCHSWACD